MHHLTEDDVLQYACEGLRDESALRIDEHAAECASCRERMRGALYLRAHSERMLDSWTADAHGAALRQLRLATALRAAASRDPTVARRAAQWLRRAGSGASSAARVALDSARNIGLSSAAWLTEGWTAGLRPALQGVASPDASAIEGILNEGMQLLSEGKTEEAVRAAEEAVKLDVRAARSTTLEIRGPGSVTIRVVADSRRKRVAVMLWPALPEAAGTVVMLIPGDESQPPAVSTFQPVAGAEYLLAEFDSLPDGEYTVEIEVLASEGPKDGGA